MARPGEEAGQGRLDLAAAAGVPGVRRPGIPALGGAVGDDQTGGPAPARPVGAEHAGHDLAVQHEIALAPVEARHRAPAPERDQVLAGRLRGQRERRAGQQVARRHRAGPETLRLLRIGLALQPAGEALRIAPGLLFPPGLPFRVAAGLGLPRTPIRGLRPDPLAGERDLGAGRRRRAHPALDRLQHLFGHRAPEARDPRLRDWSVIVDMAVVLAPPDHGALRVRQHEPYGFPPLVVRIRKHFHGHRVLCLGPLERQRSAPLDVITVGHGCRSVARRVIDGDHFVRCLVETHLEIERCPRHLVRICRSYRQHRCVLSEVVLRDRDARRSGRSDLVPLVSEIRVGNLERDRAVVVHHTVSRHRDAICRSRLTCVLAVKVEREREHAGPALLGQSAVGHPHRRVRCLVVLPASGYSDLEVVALAHAGALCADPHVVEAASHSMRLKVALLSSCEVRFPSGSVLDLRSVLCEFVYARSVWIVALSANLTETPATFGISVGRWR